MGHLWCEALLHFHATKVLLPSPRTWLNSTVTVWNRPALLSYQLVPADSSSIFKSRVYIFVVLSDWDSEKFVFFLPQQLMLNYPD